MVGVGGHHIAHMSPPLLAFRSLGDSLPTRFILDLNVTEELVSFRVKKNRVVVDSVFLEDRLQLRPDGIVPILVFLFFARVNGHYESLSYHFHEVVSMSSCK